MSTNNILSSNTGSKLKLQKHKTLELLYRIYKQEELDLKQNHQVIQSSLDASLAKVTSFYGDLISSSSKAIQEKELQLRDLEAQMGSKAWVADLPQHVPVKVIAKSSSAGDVQAYGQLLIDVLPAYSWMSRKRIHQALLAETPEETAKVDQAINIAVADKVIQKARGKGPARYSLQPEAGDITGLEQNCTIN